MTLSRFLARRPSRRTPNAASTSPNALWPIWINIWCHRNLPLVIISHTANCHFSHHSQQSRKIRTALGIGSISMSSIINLRDVGSHDSRAFLLWKINPFKKCLHFLHDRVVGLEAHMVCWSNGSFRFATWPHNDGRLLVLMHCCLPDLQFTTHDEVEGISVWK